MLYKYDTKRPRFKRPAAEAKYPTTVTATLAGAISGCPRSGKGFGSETVKNASSVACHDSESVGTPARQNAKVNPRSIAVKPIQKHRGDRTTE